MASSSSSRNKKKMKEEKEIRELPLQKMTFLRDYRWAVGLPMNQSNANLCWVLAGVKTIQAQRLIRGLDKPKEQRPLSIPDLLDNVVKDPKRRIAPDKTGAYMIRSMTDLFEFVKAEGVNYAENYPVSQPPSRKRPREELVKIKDYRRIPDGDESRIKLAIRKGYTVIAAVRLTSEWLKYKQGYYMGPELDTNENLKTLNKHSIVIAGFATELDGSNMHFVAINSAGSEWGESGFVRIACEDFRKEHRRENIGKQMVKLATRKGRAKGTTPKHVFEEEEPLLTEIFYVISENEDEISIENDKLVRR